MAVQQASVITDVALSLWQELPVFALFFASFILWRHVLPHTRRGVAASQKNKLAVSSAVGEPEKAHSRVTTRTAETYSEASTPAIQAAEKQMITLLANREFTRALNTFRSFERDGRDRHFQNEELFSSFVQSAIRVGKVDVVERMLRSMLRNGVGPSRRFWQTTLKMLSSRKHFQTCLSIHQAFSKKMPLDKVVYSCLINAALDCGESARAVDMLEIYQHVEPEIEPKDYVLFFRTFVAVADVDGAERIFRRLGAETTTLMANLLLLTCVNAKVPERAWELVQELHELEARAEAPIVDAVSYNTLIKGFAMAGLPMRCFDCLRQMRSRGVEPDDVTFGSLLDMCITDDDVGHAHQVAAHEVVDSLLGGDRAMDTVTCTLFIKGFVRTNNLEKAMEIYNRMKSHDGTRPDVVTYSVLIRAFVEAHDLDVALGLADDMAEAGLQPDDIILTHLLEGCRHAGRLELGKKLFADMLANGVKPSEFTLITLVKLHGRCGSHEEAHDLVETWEQKHGVKPSVIHYTCLVSGCLRTKQYEQAWKAYELMLGCGIQPDETCLATLLPGLVAAHMWDRLLKLATRALKGPKPVPVPSETLNSALWAMLQGDAAARTHAQQLVQLMTARGIAITGRNANRLNSSAGNG